MNEEPRYRVEMSDEARRQLADLIAEDPEAGAKLEEAIAALGRDPRGEGENAGKVYPICGAEIVFEEATVPCLRRLDHDGEHSPHPVHEDD